LTARGRLAITLRYLATGDSFLTIATSYLIGRDTVAKIVWETCSIIWDQLQSVYLQPPDVEQWKAIAREFWLKWQFPNCVGAIDGKHVRIQAPKNSGSTFYNYKNFHSIVLLASCDARYQFNMVDIGAAGSQSDGGILQSSEFGIRLVHNALNLPPDNCLPESNIRHHLYFSEMKPSH